MRTLIIAMGGLFLLAALYVTVANWACALVSLRNQRRGIDRHHSMIPIVSLLLAFFALFMWPYWPGIWVLLIPVLDIANLNLLFSPVYLIIYLWRKRGTPPQGQD